MTVQRPKVFVSSTIRDLADLREALKFWLEEMGFEVQMSEFNDFPRRPEAGTFEACFDSIRQSDYYVLVIGDQRGSWYDEPNRVSVTRQEYRVAYESLQRTDRPKIVSFVRASVLVALQEREKAEAPAQAGSLLGDPEFTRDFMREVRREEETEHASAGRGPYPPANWLTEFKTFRELTDGLKSTLRIKGPLPRVAILENLRHELEFNLRLALTKLKGKPFYLHWYLDKLREDVKLSGDEVTTNRRLTHTQIKRAVMFAATGTVPPESFLRIALDEAIVSGSLLDFDPEHDRYVASPLLKALYQLREQLDLYRSRYLSSGDRERWFSYWLNVKDRPDSGLSVPAVDLVHLFGLHDSQHNVVRLLVGILRQLYGHSSAMDVVLRPATPLMDEEQQMQAETVSEDELRAWLEGDEPRLWATLRDYSDEEKQRMQNVLRALKELLGEEKFDAIEREVMGRMGMDKHPEA